MCCLLFGFMVLFCLISFHNSFFVLSMFVVMLQWGNLVCCIDKELVANVVYFLHFGSCLVCHGFLFLFSIICVFFLFVLVMFIY